MNARTRKSFDGACNEQESLCGVRDRGNVVKVLAWKSPRHSSVVNRSEQGESVALEAGAYFTCGMG